jgi:hypothetical protein
VHMGSKRPRRGNLKRNREVVHYWLYTDYFHPTKPIYREQKLWRCFWMSRDFSWLFYKAWGTMTRTSDAYPMPLVNTCEAPEEHKTKRFVKQQEACRKDVERAFSMLQSRWAIVHQPARILSVQTCGRWWPLIWGWAWWRPPWPRMSILGWVGWAVA